MKHSGKQAVIPTIVRGRIFFLFSLITLLFWNLPFVVDVYAVAPLSALFDMLWVPMLVALFILPAISMVAWMRRRYTFRSAYFYSLLLLVASIVFLLYHTSKSF